jgi:hypothetical protein
LPARTSTSGRVLVDLCDFAFEVNEEPHEEAEVADALEAAVAADDVGVADAGAVDADLPDADVVDAA